MPHHQGRGPSPAEIADIIEAEIRAGKRTPRKALPSRSELALQYGVGQSTAYAAVEKLKDRGMVYGVQGLGVFVSEPDRWRAPPTPQ